MMRVCGIWLVILLVAFAAHGAVVTIEEVKENLRKAETLLEQLETQLQLAQSQKRTEDVAKFQQMYNQFQSAAENYKEYLRTRENLL